MTRIPILVVAVFFLIGGIAHFVITDSFIKAMPDYLSYHKELVIISGVFELLGAIGILIPRTRVLAAYGLIALVIMVYPANINMALHPERYNEISPLLLYSRLPLQFVFIWFIWWAISPERLQKRKTGLVC